MTKPAPDADSKNRIIAITLDEESIGRSGPDIEHERAIAIYDLIEENVFAPEGAAEGPFTLHIGITGNRLMFDIRREDGTAVVAHLLSLTPFRRIVKDYFMICDSYYQAIRTATPDKIEAIDMGRRGIHDEGSRTLQDRLKGKVRIDFETARRLFTLICVLHWKGQRMIPKGGYRISDQIMRKRKEIQRVDEPPRPRNPQAVLFACGLNSVRSPMAESLMRHMFPRALYVKSAGVRKGELDPFAVAVMAELGQDISDHKPITFEELDDWEGLNFDLIITLSPEAHHKALELTHTLAADVEYWPTQDPTGAEGNREQKLQAYRDVCDSLSLRIRRRFSKAGAPSG